VLYSDFVESLLSGVWSSMPARWWIALAAVVLTVAGFFAPRKQPASLWFKLP